jgi:uncharacterized protein (TIGR03437 family)
MIQVYKTIFLCSIALMWAQSAGAQTAPTYTISTVAGSGTPGFAGDGSSPTSAQLFLPYAAAVASGNIYISDQVNNRIRMATASSISTLAGTGTAGYDGDGKDATKALLFSPAGIVVDGSGNVYFSDTRNQVIRKVTSGTISTYAGNNAQGAGLNGDTGTATNAQLNTPAGLALDAKGNLYIADAGNNKIRIVNTANGINTFAGNTFSDFAGDGGPAINAELHNPQGVAVDAVGNVYIADTLNNRIRMVTLDGVIHTVAGNGIAAFKGDGGQALNASLNHPAGVAVDTAGNLYIADTFNQRIRMVLTNGKIVTIAGTGGQAYLGDGGPSTSASLNFPASVFVDPQGNLYVTDSQNYVIRKMTPSSVVVSPGVPAIKAGGIATASGFGGFTSVSSGSWIEIYGSNLAADTRLWAASDFTGSTAPTALNRTTVTIGGQPAFIEYVSPGQVNALLPSNLGLGQQPVIVQNSAGISSAFNVNVVASQPGFYAPPQLIIGGKQYVGALFQDGKTFVAPPAAIPGLTTARAKPGDIITLYGIGFGDVDPFTPAGQVAPPSSSLQTFAVIRFDGVQAEKTYSGLAPGSVGLYQFNIIVPNIPANDAATVTLSQGATTGTQTLYIAIQH